MYVQGGDNWDYTLQNTRMYMDMQSLLIKSRKTGKNSNSSKRGNH